ncbi:glycosyltransferase family protein [Comamonas badia]|uniref:glycosyltransferase family 2 protein n=1 Tax=Comamonas badia TaxID=265291 RepID=UPI0012EC0733|nr:glycosyltransferase family 2 protein [Comamonas badia]
MTAAITIHYREPGITAACIESLLADGWAPVLIWDNSADGGITLRALQERFEGDGRLLWGENQENLGFGKGMNAALAMLGAFGYSGPVLLINNDAQIVPGMQHVFLERLQSVEGDALLAPMIFQTGRKQGWLYYQPWFALVTHRHLPGSFAYLSGCCLLVQRADNTQPLFDEDFFMYGEDVELSWRWRKQGGQLILLEGVLLGHQGSASSGPASEAYERFLVSSHWLLAGKLASTPYQAWCMRLSRIFPLLTRAILRAVRYRTLRPLRAFAQGFFGETNLPISQIARR